MLQRLIGLVSEVDTRCASAESERGLGLCVVSTPKNCELVAPGGPSSSYVQVVFFPWTHTHPVAAEGHPPKLRRCCGESLRGLERVLIRVLVRLCVLQGIAFTTGVRC